MVICKAVLIDASGTLHIENTPLPGCREALEDLQNSGRFKVKIVSNTTKTGHLFKYLRDLGFRVTEEDVMTSLTCGVGYIKKNQLRPMLLLEDSAKEEFSGICVDNPNSVVVGLAPSMFNYEHLNASYRLLMANPTHKLIALHKAKRYATASGQNIGPGAFIAGLEYATGKVASVIGKPSPAFFEAARHSMQYSGENLLPEECVMIGDDIRDDVKGAQDCGMKGYLVKTGKYSKDDEMTDIKPDAVFDDFPACVRYLLSL